MKKLYILLTSFLFFFCSSTAITRASTEPLISDKSTIANDIKTLGLEIDNYKWTTLNEDYNTTNAIALSEQISDNDIINFIYFLNPYAESDYSIQTVNITLNNQSKINLKVEHLATFKNIQKYKLENSIVSINTEERVYEFNSFIQDLMIGGLYYNQLVNSDLVATFKGTEKVELNFNSYLMLESYDVFRLCFQPEFKWDSKYFWDSFIRTDKPTLFFYNFNLPQGIHFDDILDVDFIYSIAQFYFNVKDIQGDKYNNWFEKFDFNEVVNYKPDASKMIASSLENYTLDSPQTIYRYDSAGKINSYIYEKYGSDLKEDSIVMKTSDRFTETEKVSSYLEKETDFYKYQYSILFDIKEYKNITTSDLKTKFWFYDILDKVSMTRIRYMIDRVEYNAKVNDAGGKEPIDVAPPGNNSNWWKWLIVILIAIPIGVILIITLFTKGIGFICSALWELLKKVWSFIISIFKHIIQFFSWLFTSAIPSLLAAIGQGVVWFFTAVIKIMFKLVSIATYPFRLLGKIIFKREP